MDWIEAHPAFLGAYVRARDLIARHIVTNALFGLYNAAYAAFALKNLAGWQDKSTTETNVTGYNQRDCGQSLRREECESSGQG